MKKLILLPLLATVLMMTSCKTNMKNAASSAQTTSKMEESIQEADKWISMSKGACYGTCPIYTMTIHENGITKFLGKRFCAMLGPHVAQLSSEQMTSLEQHIAEIQVEELPEKFESMIADLPSTEITFYEKDGTSKSVWWNMNAPEKLVNLSTFMDSYRGELNWKIDNDAPLPEGAIGNQLLIYLNDGVSASEFAKQYSEYNFIPKKEVEPTQNYWLFEFDTKKIPSYEMFNLISKSEKTQNVRFNMKVSER